MRKAAIIGFGAFAAVALVGTGLAMLAWRELNAPLALPSEGVTFEVPNGASFRGVTTELAQRGLLDAAWLLAQYGGATGEARRIRAGEYRLEPGMTPLSLLSKLVAGEVLLHQLTIVEGMRFSDVLADLRAHPAIVATALDGAGIMAALGEAEIHPEGQFFPDTYRFPRGTRDVDVLRQAHEALATHLDAVWRTRAPNLAIDTPYQALILASIVEKETALGSERRRISGVFQQRLRRRMRLQTDPTVIYGLGDSFDGNLRRQDLEHDTPYNTYTRYGLPPTPIALPGLGALEAAVNPEVGDAIYFVATGRGDGSHYFSATLEEHERAVRQYLRQLRSREP